mmetsp:Transcript_37284/g.67967  ORF Transcript_37284/g.67967 Transcript_37284/m.67967 type:complete len:477 (-) Transcript_37284:31-1461(-)
MSLDKLSSGNREKKACTPKFTPSPLSRLRHVSQCVRGGCVLESRHCSASARPLILGRAEAHATAHFLEKQRLGSRRRKLGRTGLNISAIGFGCHRLENTREPKAALEVALKVGCNLIDVAPNYTDGDAESAVGEVLQKLFAEDGLKRQEVVIATKVGNIVGSSVFANRSRACSNVAKIRQDVWHCIEPTWIEAELSRSLQRLNLECVDVLLLHCPEFASKAPNVDMEDVYDRVARAFQHLELEVSQGRIAWYGISAAFYPLRPSDPEHLLLDRLLKLLPPDNHFAVIQCPVNFAEPQSLWLPHVLRDKDGVAVDPKEAQTALPLVAQARAHGLAILSNRPLDGLYRNMPGVLRFASNVPFHGNFQEEDVDALEDKLTLICSPNIKDDDETVIGELAAKTMKVLSSLDGVDCVLIGMKRPEYVASITKHLHTTSNVDAEVALRAVRRMHETLTMWFCASDLEEDHGTAKDWRLPPKS